MHEHKALARRIKRNENENTDSKNVNKEIA